MKDADDAKIISKWVRSNGSTQARPSSCKVNKKKVGSSQGDHRCGASHGVSDDKVSEYGLRNIENSILGVKND